MKAVLMSIQPYWVFLIIAKKMGWNINQEKTIEVRKNYPKDGNWNKVAKIYCSKDKKSFAKIPKEYQPLMERLLGKVIGKFVCNNIDEYKYDYCPHPEIGMDYDCGDNWWEILDEELNLACLTESQFRMYAYPKHEVYGWHISDLVIYDKPKELGEFERACPNNVRSCAMCRHSGYSAMKCLPITKPPQSWCYVEGVN
jgi:hypothetical protein